MKKNIKDYTNETLLKTLGISYDEYEKLDFEEQQKLLNDYHKNNPNPNNNKIVTVMIGGGDESIFIKVPKGKRILTAAGYIVAGETFEENKKRFDVKIFQSQKKQLEKTIKLDFKTWLYLFITKAIKVEHIPVIEVETKKKIDIKDCPKNEVYIFRDYDEYRNFYLMYLNEIDDVIDLAIYTRGSKGQIIALKGLCERIIIKKKMLEFYNSITQSQIDEIHAKGKLTPLEAVNLWESYNLCVEGKSKKRCDFFEYNCHKCMLETASHKLEHDDINLEISNDNPLQKKLKQ